MKPGHNDERAAGRSAHGGDLSAAEQLLRADIGRRLFGTSVANPRIGRFVVQRQIGAGGMGTVFAARDEELDRTVAVKVMRKFEARDGGRIRARMRREARALAQLSHPNVVTVYEVGEHDGGLFIAMEYVEGSTLRQWLSAAKRGDEAIIAMLVAAGRGLAAAHRRGIVHRDFKPDNVLIASEDQRPRVADFGLAFTGRALEGGCAGVPDPRVPASTAAHSPAMQRTRNAAESVTTVGGALGTPAYMAPEQLRGDPVDAASDQYSYCATLFEALHGYRLDARPATEQIRRTIPKRAHRVLSRGLAASADARFPSMDALLGELEANRRGYVPLVAGAVVFVGAAAWWLAPAACPLPTPVWTLARAAAGARFADARPTYVAATWPAVSVALDRYEQSWREQVVAACHLSSSRPDATRERALDCLEDRRAELTHLTQALVEGAQPVLETALSAAVALPPPGSCNSTAGLQSWHNLRDPAARAVRKRARDRLRVAAESLALSESGSDGRSKPQLEIAIDAAREASGMASDIADRATESEALHLLARLELRDGDTAQAEVEVEAAALAAERGGDARGRVRALSLQAYIVGQDRDRLGEARQVASQAMATLEATGDDPVLRAHLLNNLANVAARARPPDFTAAIADHRTALALLTDAAGPQHPDTITALLNLGSTLNRAGQTEEALRTLADARATAEKLWGADHPRYAPVARIYGLALLKDGKLEAATKQIEHALELNARTFGPDHPEVANDLYNLALVLRRRERSADAIELLRRGIAIREHQHSVTHPELIPWLVLLGRAALDSGREELAAQVLQRAIELCELDGAQPVEFAKIRALLAQALITRNPGRAAALIAQAREFYARSPESSQVVAELDALAAGASSRPP